MSFLVPNIFTPDTLADANAVNANFTYVDNALNTLEGMIGAPITGFFVSTMKTSNTAATNTAALQADLNALVVQGGGTYLLPYGNCNIAGAVYIGAPVGAPPPGIYAPIRIQGAGNNSTLTQTLNTDIFQCNYTTSGGLDGPGVDIMNCRLLYNGGLTSGAAVRAVSGQSLRLDKIFFDDCPVAIAADNAAQMSIFRCLGIYAMNTSPAGLAMVTIGTTSHGTTGAAVEVYMGDCSWRTTPINGGGAGGNGLALFGIEHFRCANTRIEAFQVGVIIAPSTIGKQAQKLHFENVSVYTASNTTGSGAGLLVQPQSGQTVQKLVLVNFETSPGANSGTTYTGAGIVLDASLGGIIDQTRLVSCDSSGWNGPGLRAIGTGGTLENTQVDGGAFICNGQTLTGANGAGIYVSGTTGFYVTGAQLDNFSSIYSGTQSYGFANDASSADTWVRGCAMAGNVTSAIYSNGTFVHFCAIDCRGYNNLNTQIAGIAQVPGNLAQFDGTTIGATPYFGPILVIWSGGTVSNSLLSHDRGSLGAVVTGQTTGNFRLNVGDSMSLAYSGAPTSFTVWGQ